MKPHPRSRPVSDTGSFPKKPLPAALAVTLCALPFLVAPVFAQTAPAPAPAAAASDAEQAKKDGTATQLERVIVTATGRAQPASKVPYNVTALSEEALREANITDVKKLIQQSVGLSAPENGARFADSVTVRGLNVSPVNANNLEQFVRSTLSYYLDDTPLPNIGYRIKDINRVETLLGPQGTLYGAGSLGGTIRYITNKPDVNAREARFNTSLYQTRYGGLSNDTDVVANLPLGKTFALRAAISNLDEKGYTDRVSNPPWRTGSDAWVTQPNANQNVYENDDWQRVKGGRFSALWKPLNNVQVLVAHTLQDQKAHGTSATSLLPLSVANARNPAERDAAWRDPSISLENLPCAPNCIYGNERATPFVVNDHTVLSRYPEFADRKFRMSSIDFDVDLGFAALHSATSQFKDTRAGQADYASQGWAYYSAEAGGSFTDFGADIASGRSAYMTFDNSFRGVSHETRLTSKNSGPFNWIAGLYHANQKRSFKFSEWLPGMESYLSSQGRSLALSGGNKDEGYREDLNSNYRETALFAELGFRATSKWLTTIGARVFNYKDTAGGLIIDYAGDAAGANRNVSVSDSGKAYYKFNTSYEITPDVLAYATFSQGFRRGGTNPFRNEGARIVKQDVVAYQPDSTDNYEVGVKGYLANRRLYIETALYQIDWKDPQTYRSQTVGGVFPVNGTTNGPDARSRGFEFSSRLKLSDALQLSFATSTSEGKWVDSKRQCLYEETDANGNPVSASRQSCRSWNAGGKLGGAPKWKHTFGARFTHNFANDVLMYASLTGRYVGKVQNDRSDDPADNDFVVFYPAFTRYNASVGFSRDNWEVQLWGENITNKREIVSQQAQDDIMGRRLILTTPRTLGVNFSYGFK